VVESPATASPGQESRTSFVTRPRRSLGAVERVYYECEQSRDIARERERRLERLKELKRSADPGLFDELEKCVDTEEQ
jgi:hypothetical protein